MSDGPNSDSTTARWFYASGEGRAGPKTISEMRRLLEVGEITVDTLVWCQAFGQNWKPFSDAGIAQAGMLPPRLPTSGGARTITTDGYIRPPPELHSPSAESATHPPPFAIRPPPELHSPSALKNSHLNETDKAKPASGRLAAGKSEPFSSKDMGRLMNWVNGAFIFILVVAMIIVFNGVGPFHPPSNTAQIPFTIEATALEDEFTANNFRAEEKYKNQIWTVVGNFSGAETKIFGGVQVDMRGGILRRGIFPSFSGTLALGEENAVTRFNIGEPIRLRCRLKDSVFGIPRGENCYIVR